MVGGLRSYGTDATDIYRQTGVHAGNILNGAKPADLPVVQATKFIFASTCKPLGRSVSRCRKRLAVADEVIQ
jgi:putative ABC transport system substrate-binding protein